MRTITLQNGTQFAVSQCGAADGFLWLTMEGYAGTFMDAALLFSDAAATGSIFHSYDGNDETTFVGYTELVRVEVLNGELRVTLHQKEEA